MNQNRKGLFSFHSTAILFKVEDVATGIGHRFSTIPKEMYKSTDFYELMHKRKTGCADDMEFQTRCMGIEPTNSQSSVKERH